MAAMPIPQPLLRGTVKSVNGPMRCGLIRSEDGSLYQFTFYSLPAGIRIRKRQPVEFELLMTGPTSNRLTRAVKVRPI